MWGAVGQSLDSVSRWPRARLGENGLRAVAPCAWDKAQKARAEVCMLQKAGRGK